MLGDKERGGERERSAAKRRDLAGWASKGAAKAFDDRQKVLSPRQLVRKSSISQDGGKVGLAHRPFVSRESDKPNSPARCIRLTEKSLTKCENFIAKGRLTRVTEQDGTRKGGSRVVQDQPLHARITRRYTREA